MSIIRIIFFVAFAGIILIKFCEHVCKKKKEIPSPEADGQTEEKNPAKEDLQFTLETVNSWVNNCDQKAGILLAVIGVAMTVLLTSDFLKFLRHYIFYPFVQYCNGNSGLSFSWSRFTVFFFLIVATALLITSCFYLFRAICANIDYQKMFKENPNLEKTSYIFYGTINSMSYDEFKKRKIDYEDDLKSQIYVNSKIATKKYENYNEGLFWFRFTCMVAVMLFIAVMIVQ